MPGTREGVIRAHAGRLGMTMEEYRGHVAAGEKWCTGCKAWHRRALFATDRSRGDGLAAMCAVARRRIYRSRATGAPMGTPPMPPRDGDAEQARQRVNVLVRTGRLPRPNDLPCADCGHVWAEGERRHEYDHHLGYGAAHHLDVEAVCTTCHHSRERVREFPEAVAT